MDSFEAQASRRKGRAPEVSRSGTKLRVGILATGSLLTIVASLFLYDRGLVRGVTPDGPVVCRNPTWDFGTVSQDKPQGFTHAFKLTNVSKQVVSIMKVSPDCGCVAAEQYPSEIGPGATVELAVTATVGGKPGLFQKKVAVVLGASPGSILVLHIRGNLVASPAFLMAPTTLDFGLLDQDEIRARSVRIARYDASPIRFLRATPRSDALKVENVACSNDNADSLLELKILLNSGTLKAGDEFRSSVIVATRHSGYPQIEIPVTAKVAAQPQGIIGSIFIDRLSAGEFRDYPLIDLVSNSPRPTVEQVHYEGKGAITVELLVADNHRTIPTVRVKRMDKPVELRVCRGDLVLRLCERKNPVKIPLTVYLNEN
jgi:hypothetical protein